jgi:hypothetical protein
MRQGFDTMDDQPYTGKDRYFSSADDGPDTVRILPDDQSSPAEDEWFVEQHPAHHGALYTPTSGQAAPAAKAPESPPSGAAAFEPEASRALQPYDNKPLQAPADATRVTHIYKGPSACAIIAATVGVLLLSCALLTFATVKNGFDGIGKLAGVFPSILSSPTVTIDTSRPTVLDEVRALSKLETVHYQLEKVVTGKSSGPLPDFLTSDKILLVAHGEVVAGVDLSKITADDVKVVSNTVTIRLPKAEVLYSKLDNDKTYVYDRQTGIFSRPDPNLETQIRQAAEQDILNTAMEDGILDQASTNAQDVLRTLLNGLGYKQVNFTQGP